MIVKVVFFLALILGLTIYFNLRPEHSDSMQNIFKKNQIISYRIGNIDPRFQLSEEDVRYLAYEATQIWEKATNQTLFQYDPNAKLKINLIYDERQQRSIYVDEMNTNIDKKSNELDEMASKLDQQLKNLRQKDNELQQAYQQLRNEQQAWRGWEFEDGENLQRLKQEEMKLKQRSRQLDNARDTYHLNVENYNRKVHDFNQQAQQAREFNQKTPSRLFHKGTYSGDQIDIYQFANKNDLKVTLAHEFGHALGLGHHQDPTALMYPSVAQQDVENFKLLPADLALLQQAQ